MSHNLFPYPNIPISDEGKLSREAKGQFFHLSPDDQFKFLISTRAVKAMIDEEADFVPVRNPPSQINDDESELTFPMFGRQVTLPNLRNAKAEKFTISVVKNGMSIDEYTNKYVEPWIRECRNPDTGDLTFNILDKVAWRDKSPAGFGAEKAVEEAFKTYLHNAIEDIILENVRNLQPDTASIEQINTYFRRKQALYKILSKENLATDSEALPALEPLSGFQISLKNVGLNCIPDYGLGLSYKYKDKFLLVLPMGIGEIKTPHSALGNTYQIIRGIPNSFKGETFANISFKLDENFVPTAPPPQREKPLGKMLSTFQQTLTKLVTESIHAGIKKMIISDYTFILFIELDENLVVSENKSLIKKYPISTKSNNSGISQGSEGPIAFVKDVYAHCVQAKHCLIPTSHPLIKTFLIAFFWQTNEERSSQLKFQAKVDEFLIEVEKKRPNVSYGKFGNNSGDSTAGPTADSTANTDPNTDADFSASFSADYGGFHSSGMSTGLSIAGSRNSSARGNPTSGSRDGLNEQNYYTAMSGSEPPSESTRLFSAAGSLENDHTQVSESLHNKKEFHFIKDLFLMEFKLHLDRMIVHEICCGSDLNSQTIVVKSAPFLAAVSDFDGFNLDFVSDTSVAKIFDSDYSSGSFSKLADRAVNEVMIYESAKSLMGKTIPFVFHYGLFRDSTIKSGVPYDRYQGYYILLEDLSNNINDSIVLTENVQKNIYDAYRNLHEANIIHNDVKFENLIFLNEDVVKIIDFSHSYKSTDVADHLEEMRRVEMIFGTTGILASNACYY